MTRRSVAIVAATVLLATLVAGVAPATAAAPAATAPATAAQEDCSFPVTVTDATGTEVTLEEPPERIVVTAPSAAQTIWELGEQDRVVGMPVGEGQGTGYLEGSENRTHVLDGFNVDREQIVALEPDLVIAPGVTSEDDVQAMREDGLTVYYEGDSASIDDIRENVNTTGRMLGACDAAAETVDWMNQRLAAVEDAVEGEDSPSVLYWIQGGFTPPAGTFQHDLLQRAGAENAAADMEFQGDSWQLANQEQIVEEDPEYLLLQEGDEVPDNEALQSTTAVQEDNVIHVNRNYWNQNAPRVVLAVEQIAEQLHPQAFEENATDGGAADDENESDADDGAMDDEADDGSSDDGAADDGSPGFGVPAAVAALVAIVGALARRD